ncbi:MAG: serine hydrolase [Clostridia bacterium]|nr:serine hydrolase [Clostridia bacterium]
MISSQSILAFIDRLERENVCLHGFELREAGQIRAEGYYAPFAKGQPHRMYSVSKSMVSLAVGLLADDGKLSLDDCIISYFPDKLQGEPDGRLASLTIRDMLRMATCYRKTTYREGIDPCWSDSFFTTKPDHEPGTMFFYDTSCSQVLGELCQRVSVRPLLDLLTERVFAPLGANDEKRWLTDPSGIPQGGTGLLMSLADMAKVAQCILDGGCGVLPAWYLQEATSKKISTHCQGNPEERYGYGWQFWRTRSGYVMYGMGGQLAVFCPEEKVLLCTIADTRLDPYGVQRIYDAFYGEIMAHPDEKDEPQAQEKLSARLAGLVCAAVPHEGGSCRQGERAYVMEENDGGLRRLLLEDGCAVLEWEDAVHRFAWDAFGVCREAHDTGLDASCLVSAGVACDGTLRVRCQLIGHAPCGLELLIGETDSAVSLRMMKSSDPKTNRYDGLIWGKRV